MFTIESRPLRAAVTWMICIAAFAAVGFLSKALIVARQKALATAQQARQRPNMFFRDGFNFDKLRGKNNQWKGPAFGEKIDLTQLRGKDNVSHPDAGKTGLLMVDCQPLMQAM